MRATIISYFIAAYEFDVGEILAWDMKYRVVGGGKSLLAYPYLITQLCLAAGVWDLLGIKEIIDATNTSDLGLNRDTTNPMARQARQGVDMLAKMYRSQIVASKTAEASGQTRTTQTSAT